jgi:hypothetical protein
LNEKQKIGEFLFLFSLSVWSVTDLIQTEAKMKKDKTNDYGL